MVFLSFMFLLPFFIALTALFNIFLPLVGKRLVWEIPLRKALNNVIIILKIDI